MLCSLVMHAWGSCGRGLTLRLLLLSKATPPAAGIAPYMALELASYDLMPSDVPAFAKGFTAALFATSICYPLDTVRCVQHQLAVHSFLLHVSSCRAERYMVTAASWTSSVTCDIVQHGNAYAKLHCSAHCAPDNTKTRWCDNCKLQRKHIHLPM